MHISSCDKTTSELINLFLYLVHQLIMNLRNLIPRKSWDISNVVSCHFSFLLPVLPWQRSHFLSFSHFFWVYSLFFFPENVLMRLPIVLYIRYILHSKAMCLQSSAGTTLFLGSNNKGCKWSESREICKHQCILRNRLVMRTLDTKTKCIHSMNRITTDKTC